MIQCFILEPQYHFKTLFFSYDTGSKSTKGRLLWSWVWEIKWEKVTCTHTSPTICFTDIPPGYIPPPLPSHDFLRPASFPFDHTRHTEASTQGASKMRRDSINGEVMKLRDLLPLPPSTRYLSHSTRYPSSSTMYHLILHQVAISFHT